MHLTLNGSAATAAQHGTSSFVRPVRVRHVSIRNLPGLGPNRDFLSLDPCSVLAPPTDCRAIPQTRRQLIGPTVADAVMRRPVRVPRVSTMDCRCTYIQCENQNMTFGLKCQ